MSHRPWRELFEELPPEDRSPGRAASGTSKPVT